MPSSCGVVCWSLFDLSVRKLVVLQARYVASEAIIAALLYMVGFHVPEGRPLEIVMDVVDQETASRLLCWCVGSCSSVECFYRGLESVLLP